MSANNKDGFLFFQEMRAKILKKNSLSERSLAAVWHPCTQMKDHEAFDLISIKSAKGPWLIDENNRHYFDAISSWWVTLFGHRHEPIVQAISEQAKTLDHVLLAGCTHDPAVELAEKLMTMVPQHPNSQKKLSRCLFSSDGASSVETALKLAIHYWKNKGHSEKKRFVKLEGSYHGETSGAMSVTDIALFRNAYEALLIDSETLLVPDSRLVSEGMPSDFLVEEHIRKAEQLFEEKKDQLAAVIVEPLIQCANGMRFYEAGFLTELRRLCDQYNMLLIADEVAVGMGRTGTLFACEQANIVPDILCLSKGLSGGTLPLSVTLANKEIYDAFYDDQAHRAFLHSHSYTGNPIACRAAVTVLDCLEKNQQLKQNEITAKKITAALADISTMPIIENFRHKGMIWAFEVRNNLTNFSKRFSQTAARQGLLLRPVGNTVYIMPPYLLNDEDIAFLAEKLKTTLLLMSLD